MKHFIFTTTWIISLFCQSIQADDLTSAEHFFQIPKVQSAALNPDGSNVVTITNIDEGTQILVLHDTNTEETRQILNVDGLFENEAQIQAITWVDSNTIAAQFIEMREGLKNLIDTRIVRYLLLIRVPEAPDQSVKVYQVKTSGWLIHPLPEEPNKFLYAKSGIKSHVYKLDVRKLQEFGAKRSKLTKRDGGQFTKKNSIASVSGYAVRWFIDQQGKVNSALHFTKQERLVLSALHDDAEPNQVYSWNKKDLETDSVDNEDQKETEQLRFILPVAAAKEKNSYYGLDIRDENERIVYKVNYQSAVHQQVFQSSAYKIQKLLFSSPEKELIGVQEIRNGKYFNNYFASSDVATHPEKVAHKPVQDEIISTLQQSIDGTIRLIYTESHNQPGHFYISASNRDSPLSIQWTYPHLLQLKSKLIEGSINVKGLDIPYLLTLPENRDTAPYPLLVLPHGGPFGIFDHRYFNLATQYFAQNGFAILRVNFRGSGGYSKALEEAGKMQWGNLMLHDLYRVTLEISEREDIASEKICAFGMSYGGYAATMLNIQHPEVYKCGVNVAGVSDVNLFLNSPTATEGQLTWLKEHVGDTLRNYSDLKAISPVYNIHKLTRPILVIHGTQDRIVDVEHAYRLKAALDKYNKIYEWHILPEGKHNLGNATQTAETYARILNFIQRHIGSD